MILTVDIQNIVVFFIQNQRDQFFNNKNLALNINNSVFLLQNTLVDERMLGRLSGLLYRHEHDHTHDIARWFLLHGRKQC